MAEGGNQLTHRIAVEPGDADSLAPFGALLGRRPGLPVMPIDYYRGTVAVSRPVDFFCKGDVELSLTTLQPRPGKVRYMERHYMHTQTFIPLAGKPFVIVMAPPNNARIPDLASLRAFRLDGQAGLMLHPGTWHEFPFPLAPDSDVIVALSRQTTEDLRNKDPETEEAFGPDLEKIDLVRRLGLEIDIDLNQE